MTTAWHAALITDGRLPTMLCLNIVHTQADGMQSMLGCVAMSSKAIWHVTLHAWLSCLLFAIKHMTVSPPAVEDSAVTGREGSQFFDAAYCH